MAAQSAGSLAHAAQTEALWGRAAIADRNPTAVVDDAQGDTALRRPERDEDISRLSVPHCVGDRFTCDATQVLADT